MSSPVHIHPGRYTVQENQDGSKVILDTQDNNEPAITISAKLVKIGALAQIICNTLNLETV